MKRDRSARAILAITLLLGACSPLTLAVTCDARLSQLECDQIATFALESRRDEAVTLGEIREVETTLLADCRRAARSELVPLLADASIGRCWRVDIRWQRGQTRWFVARHSTEGVLLNVER